MSGEAAITLALALGMVSLVSAVMLFGLFGAPDAETFAMRALWVFGGIGATVTGFVMLGECTSGLWRRWRPVVMLLRVLERASRLLHWMLIGMLILALLGLREDTRLLPADWLLTLLSPGFYLFLLPGALLIVIALIERHMVGQETE